MGILCCIVIALFVGGAVGMATMADDAERERMEQANEILNLRLENEYLHMCQAEIRDKVDKMEPPHEYNVLYNRGWNDAVEEVRRYVE